MFGQEVNELKHDSNMPPFGRCKFRYLNLVAKFRILGKHDLEEVMQTYQQNGAYFKTYFYKTYFYKIRIEFSLCISVLISISVSRSSEV